MCRSFFSIVIPTKQRPEWIEYCLYSLKQQTFKNFEVIVCDNEFTKTCKHVFDKYADQRFRYIQPPMELSLERNWAYAMQFVEGEYIGYIQDKMYFYRDSLSEVYQCIMNEDKPESVSWSIDIFNLENRDNGSVSGYLNKKIDSSSLNKKINGMDALYEALECSHYWCGFYGTPGPGTLCMGVLRRDVVEKVFMGRGIEFWDGVSPDFTGAIMALPYCKRCIFFNKHLGVMINARPTNGEANSRLPSRLINAYNTSDTVKTVLSFAVIPNYPVTVVNYLTGEYNYVLSKMEKCQDLHCNRLNNLIGIAQFKHQYIEEKIPEKIEEKYREAIADLSKKERDEFYKHYKDKPQDGLNLCRFRYYRNPKECIDDNVSDNDLVHIREFANRYKYLCCYGAGDYALLLLDFLKQHKIILDCFVVTNLKMNKLQLSGLPVVELSKLQYPPEETGIFLGLKADFHGDVFELLHIYGYENICYQFDYEKLR